MTEKFDKEFPKVEPLTDNCDGCGTDYYITSFNGLIYHFEGQPDCDYLFCACPECNYRTRIYINQTTVENARALGIPEDNTNRYAPDMIYREWCDVRDVKLPPVYELTPRHEETITRFGQSILNMPDDLLNEGWGDDTSRPYPERWV